MVQALNAEVLYDRLAENYHILTGDGSWEDTVREHGQKIHRLLVDELSIEPPADILDCSCGIGLQSIGLALAGYQVTGSDISAKSIERAAQDARRMGVNIRCAVADFMELEHVIEGDYDVVLSWGNGIAYVSTIDDLYKAFCSMRSKLRDGGRLLVSTRDYEALASSAQPHTPPLVHRDGATEYIYFQLWDWSADKTSYAQKICFLRRPADGTGDWSLETFDSTMRAFVKPEIETALTRAGFDDVRWCTPEWKTLGMLAFSARYSHDRVTNHGI